MTSQKFLVRLNDLTCGQFSFSLFFVVFYYYFILIGGGGVNTIMSLYVFGDVKSYSFHLSSENPSRPKICFSFCVMIMSLQLPPDKVCGKR